MKKLLLVVLISFFSITPGSADEGVKVGDNAPSFNLKNIDGTEISLSDYSEKKGVIVIFTCNHCPFSKAYEDRIIELQTTYEPKGYPVVAINPNDVNKVPEDSFENMKLRAKEKDFNFPYLHDESQSIARKYGATRTPHVFLLSPNGKDFIVSYIGAIDNNVKDANAADEKYIEEAIKDLEEGNEVQKSMTKAIGCTIKWKE